MHPHGDEEISIADIAKLVAAVLHEYALHLCKQTDKDQHTDNKVDAIEWVLGGGVDLWE